MLNMHAFNYGLFYATVGVILLPEEAMTMFPGSHAVMLACMLALAGLSQLISPFAGYLSDRQTGKFGRRVPYLLAGNAVLLLMIGTHLPLPCLYPTSHLYPFPFPCLPMYSSLLSDCCAPHVSSSCHVMHSCPNLLAHGCVAGALYLARSYLLGYLYMALLLVAILALNVAYTGFTGLVSDMIPTHQVYPSHLSLALSLSHAHLALICLLSCISSLRPHA